jgi:hypothetical protein
MAYSQVLAAQASQADALERFGFMVKNTFIDDVSPPAEEGTPAARRTCSVPAMSRLAGHRGSDAKRVTRSERLCRLSSPLGSPVSTRYQSPAARSRNAGSEASDEEGSLLSSPGSTCCQARRRDLSPASSTCSTDVTGPVTCLSSDTLCSGMSWAEASAPEAEPALLSGDGAEDAAAGLAALVVRECGFLRMASQDFYEETNRVRRLRGVAKCVVFHCRGLPWAKRSKWLQPLLWSVAAVLRLKGVTARMQSGELYAQLPGADSSSCNLVRLDFAAARE